VSLETSVGHIKDIQESDVNSELKNCVVTLRVMSKFFNFLGALRARADFCDPIDLSRVRTTYSIKLLVN